MVTLDQSQELGFAITGSGTIANPTDPINAADAKYWKHGVLTHAMQNSHPVAFHDWQSIYKQNLRNPADTELQKTFIQKGLVFLPVNLIPYYLIFGSSSTDGGGIHTINNINTGELPVFTVRSESSGGTVDKIFSAVGCKAASVSGMIVPTTTVPLSMTMTYLAIKAATAGNGLGHNGVHNGAVYPTADGLMNGTQTSGRFRKDSNFAFRWDSGGTPVVYDNEVANISWLITSGLQPGYVENQSELEFIDEGNYQILVSFELFRGADKGIYDDFLAKTQHSAYVNINAGATNYQKLTWSKISLTRCDAPHVQGNASKKWFCQGLAEDLTITGIDGISKTEFYGE